MARIRETQSRFLGIARWVCPGNCSYHGSGPAIGPKRSVWFDDLRMDGRTYWCWVLAYELEVSAMSQEVLLQVVVWKQLRFEVCALRFSAV